jgi:DNA polymerase III gamma/tau subunit
VWCIDECHELTKQAQDAFLKVLEDTPSHVYFFLATTDPAKLLPTIRSRCTEIKVKALAPSVMTKMLGDVCKRAKAQMPSDVLDKIVNLAEGGARKALVLLNQVMELTSEDAQLAALEQSDAKHASIEIARALINPRCVWGDVAKLIKAVDDEPEQIRRLVLGYCSSIVLGGGKLAPRAISVIYNFSGNFYDSGKAGLVFAAWNVINSK